MANETVDLAEPKEAITSSLRVSVIRIIQYRAFLDGSNRSEAVEKLILAGAQQLRQETPEVERERVA